MFGTPFNAKEGSATCPTKNHKLHWSHTAKKYQGIMQSISLPTAAATTETPGLKCFLYCSIEQHQPLFMSSTSTSSFMYRLSITFHRTTIVNLWFPSGTFVPFLETTRSTFFEVNVETRLRRIMLNINKWTEVWISIIIFDLKIIIFSSVEISI